MKTTLVGFLLLASAVYAQQRPAPQGVSIPDALRVGSLSAPRGSTVDVPLYLSDAPYTPLGEDQPEGQHIQGIAFKAVGNFDSIDFIRGGVLSGTPLYERVIPGTGAVGYIALFGNSLAFTQSGDPGDLIGHLRVTIPESAAVGSTIALQIEPATVTVSNETGTIGETAGAFFAVVDGTVTVEKAATTTTLISSKNPSTASESVTFTATVTSDVGDVNGNIYFYDGAQFLGGGPSTAGQRSHTALSLNPGAHDIKAQYLGDAEFAESESTLIQNVQFGPPHSFEASATSTTSVFMAWPEVAGADHYDVYWRSDGQPFAKLQSVNTGTASHLELTPGKTYLYYVVAVDSTGLQSGPSVIDPASTIFFTDWDLDGLVVKSLHVMELRQAIHAFRSAVGGMGAVTYGDASTGAVIRASHVQELRDALAAARASGNIPSLSFTDSPLISGASIKAEHIEELQRGIR